ncbi:hypothetical protein BDN67DRAFT_991793 [Paxillus ammoniavirescens]|nr:hypothetical protein BDN67DRAFT_991793 [Paxillus ammoniavirescens]
MGAIRLTSQNYRARKVTHPQLAQHTEHWGHCLPDEEDIPECRNDLPPEVDLSILDAQPQKQTASTSPATIRCDKCFGVNMYCLPCILSLHEKNPLHRLKEWTGECFEKRTLRDFGLHIQLGHAVGERCCRPCSQKHDEFVIIHTNGIHLVYLDFCGCETVETLTHQLLCVRWFPASSEKPRIAATFSLLEVFHLLSFESKVSAYEFYNSLTWCSNNTGLLPKNDHYEQFLSMSQEWRHLKLLKRSGRGHDPAGIANTEEGACAVLCPACPQPGKNLPAHWDKAPKEKSWLYSLFVAIDANFWLKHRVVSKDSVGPSLSQGWAYFVAEAAYKSHLKKHLDQPQEKSTCASHNAVNMADTKCSKGLAATGVGTVDCAWHGMKLPCGVGDLQKGEKYINMDYLFFSSQQNTAIKTLNISYDIVCQWHKGLWAHMSTLPPCLQLKDQQMLISFLVPKFHLPAHIAQCQWEFTFNWQPGVARTDGEAPERRWADINCVASSTKQMGPGHRQDILDDHFRDWNWKKLVGLGALLLHKIQEAIPKRNEHQDDFDELTQSLQDRYPDLLVKWKHEVEEWETDQKKLNLFEVRTEYFTQASVQLQLARDEAKVALNAVTETTGDNPPTPEDFALHLPSQICHKVACSPELEEIEWKLQEGQAHNTLNELQQALRSRTYMLKFKHWFLCGQGANTRARNCLKSIDDKINASASKYRATHHALLTLSSLLGKVRWKSTFNMLADDDIRGMSNGLSWIWKACSRLDSNTDDEADEGLQDEVDLLFEEKHQILAFLEWNAAWWSERAHAITTNDVVYAKGLWAYAKRQASLCQDLSK